MITFKMRERNEFVYDKSVYTKKEVIQKIKDGYDLKIEDLGGFDITKEFLMNIIFKKYEDAYNYLLKDLTKDDLYDMIDAGGYEALMRDL